eukprot:gene30491-36852_t
MIGPWWPKNTTYDMFAFLATKPKLLGLNASMYYNKENILLEQRNLVHTEQQEMHSHTQQLTLDRNNLLSLSLFERLQSNSSQVYLHVIVCKRDPSKSAYDLPDIIRLRNLFNSGQALHGSINMIKYQRIPRYFHHRNLLSDLGLVTVDPEDLVRLNMPLSTVISFWKPEVAVKLVNDFTQYPVKHIPQTIARNTIEASRPATSKLSNIYYKPALYVDEIGLTSDKYVHLNSSVEQLPIKISIGPMSTQRWLVMGEIERGLAPQKAIGFSDRDLDDVRRLIADTSLPLLSATLLASMLHLYFEALAFQSDIAYWRKVDRPAGISKNSLIFSLVSQIVVFLYLTNNDTSMIVIIPALIGLFIQIWKVMKAQGIRVKFFYRIIPALEYSATKDIDVLSTNPVKREEKDGSEAVTTSCSDKDIDHTSVAASEPQPSNTLALAAEDRKAKLDRYRQASAEADQFAYSLLTTYMTPVLLAWCVYSLVYEKHLSWYSFVLTSLTGYLYAFGFVFMFPQLYINHKLKTVVHLPWAMLVYKFINTFIDGIVSFCSSMSNKLQRI